MKVRTIIVLFLFAVVFSPSLTSSAAVKKYKLCAAIDRPGTRWVAGTDVKLDQYRHSHCTWSGKEGVTITFHDKNGNTYGVRISSSSVKSGDRVEAHVGVYNPQTDKYETVCVDYMDVQ